MNCSTSRSKNLLIKQEIDKKSSFLKETVNVISSDPPLQDGNARFTTVPWSLYLINNMEDIVVFLGLKVLTFRTPNSYMKCTSHTFAENPQLKTICFPNYKHEYQNHTWSDKATNGTIVNRVLTSLYVSLSVHRVFHLHNFITLYGFF